MQQDTAADFFTKLHELMQATEVTDGSGASMSLTDGAQMAIQMILDIRSGAGKMMLAGNGGSSAIVSHVQNDLCKAVGVRAMVFTEQPLLTALANDDGYGSVYEQPIQMWGQPEDLLMTVSSSGNSENILRAVKAAKDKGCQVITLSGFNVDNGSRSMGDLNFYVPSHTYAYVETAHTALAHYLTDQSRIRVEALSGANSN
jgi:D-sedoheptulose 7-phosphate isomerase